MSAAATEAVRSAMRDLCEAARQWERLERLAGCLEEDLRRVAVAAQIAALGRERWEGGPSV